MSSTQLRTYTSIEYIVYMYNLGTAPNVQNWAGFAVCTPMLDVLLFHFYEQNSVLYTARALTIHTVSLSPVHTVVRRTRTSTCTQVRRLKVSPNKVVQQQL